MFVRFLNLKSNILGRYEKARWKGARANAQEKLYDLLVDEVPEVRAAAVFALGTFVRACEDRTEHANHLDQQVALHMVNAVVGDGEASPLVRCELVVALQYVVLAFEHNFIAVARVAVAQMEEEKTRQQQAGGFGSSGSVGGSGSLRRAGSRDGLKGGQVGSGGGMGQLAPSASTTALDRLGTAAVNAGVAGGAVGGGSGMNRSSSSLNFSSQNVSSNLSSPGGSSGFTGAISKNSTYYKVRFKFCESTS